MKVKAAAKINLALDVTGKLENGYHTIESVFQTVGLYDEVTVELTDSGIELSCEVPEEFASADPIPCDERNIAYKAARKFFDENGVVSDTRYYLATVEVTLPRGADGFYQKKRYHAESDSRTGKR